MRWKFTFDDALVIIAFAALLYFRNWQVTVLFVAVLVYVVIRQRNTKKNEPSVEDNEFVIDDDDKTLYTAQLDIDLNFRKLPNHFRTDYGFDTYTAESLYEYRVEGTDVLSRLMTAKSDDIDDQEHYDVRDGVVLESDMLKKAEGRTDYFRTSTEERIANLKKEVEWSKMTPMSWHGLKYFIISKKLPTPDARRYLRQELERLKVGTAAFFKEAEKYGLVRDENSLERLKVAEEKPTPSAEEFRQLNESAEKFGITDLEFSWGKKLCGVLEKLLGD